MAVFTPVSRSELAGFLARYNAGTLVGYRGIASGTANTNYFVTTTVGEFVLTLFENLDPAQVPFFLELTGFLAARGLPCARPVADRDGALSASLRDRPAALVERLSGASVERPDVEHCRVVGRMLARLHLAARDYPAGRDNPFDERWVDATFSRVARVMDSPQRALLEDEIAYQRDRDMVRLPRGLIHADLFRDNVLFMDHHVSGVIDFYFACTDSLLLDLAITVNDWCVGDDGVADRSRVEALVQAYGELRPLTPEEHAAWGDVLRRAALRFWLSRLADWHYPRDREMADRKDPDAYRARLVTHRRGDL